jgi:hypothetical protein
MIVKVHDLPGYYKKAHEDETCFLENPILAQAWLTQWRCQWTVSNLQYPAAKGAENNSPIWNARGGGFKTSVSHPKLPYELNEIGQYPSLVQTWAGYLLPISCERWGFHNRSRFNSSEFRSVDSTQLNFVFLLKTNGAAPTFGTSRLKRMADREAVHQPLVHVIKGPVL